MSPRPLPPSHRPLILLGADHAGYPLKEAIRKEFVRRGYALCDFTPKRVKGDDYPIVGRGLGKAVVTMADREEHDRTVGVLVCGSGVGMAIAANRIPGVRAFVGHSADEIRRARNDEDANILTLSDWSTTPAKAIKLVQEFLDAPASGEQRHRRRIEELG